MDRLIINNSINKRLPFKKKCSYLNLKKNDLKLKLAKISK